MTTAVTLAEVLRLTEQLSPLDKVRLIEHVAPQLERDLQLLTPRRSLRGLWRGLANAGWETVTAGLSPWTLSNHADWTALEKLDPPATQATRPGPNATSSREPGWIERTLPPRDAKVLRLYFGLDGGREHTLEEIGSMLGVTRERVRQLRDRALARLKEGEVGRALASFAA